MEKRNIILLVLTFIIGILLGLALALFVGLTQNDSNIDESSNNNNNQINNENNNNSNEEELKNEIIQTGNDYIVHLNESSLIINEVVKWTEDDPIEYINMTISNFKLNGKESTIQLTNVLANPECVFDNKNTEVLLNEKVLFSYEYEGCYLVNIFSIFIIEDKYIGIHYGGENITKTIGVYDASGTKIYENEKVIDFDLKNLSFKSYDDNDSKYMLNTYELEVVSDKISEKMITKGTESYCDMTCSEGLPCC